MNFGQFDKNIIITFLMLTIIIVIVIRKKKWWDFVQQVEWTMSNEIQCLIIEIRNIINFPNQMP